MTRQYLTFGLQLADADVDTQRRTVTGLMVPWGQSARNGGKRWRFARGGQRYGHLGRIKLLRDHENASAMGRAISIEDTEQGLVGTFKVSPGARGDEALALAADGVLDGFSIGAEWREEDYGPDPLDPGGYLVHQYAIRECSLTAMPAFDDSRLTAVRASDEGEEPVMPENSNPGAPAQPETQPTSPAPQRPEQQPTAPPETPGVTPAPGGPAVQQPEREQETQGQFSAQDVMRLLAAAQNNPAATSGGVGIAPPAAPEQRPTVDPTAHATPAPQAHAFVREALPYRFTHQQARPGEPGRHIFHAGQQHDFSTDLFRFIDSNGSDVEAGKRVNALIRAAFDTDITDLAGVIPARNAPELWQPQMDYATPLWDMINSGGTNGEPFILPKYNSSSGLVSAATEGTEPAPGAFTVTTQTITPTQLWGKVELTRQLVRRGGNPQISGIIWDQMLREYYEDREAAVATFLNTLTAATDITLTGTPAATPDNDDDQTTVNDLERAIADLQFVRGGNRFRAFAVHQDLYRVLARVKDDSGRPLYPQVNPMNANGTTSGLYTTINIAGVTAVPAWALGAGGQTTAQNSWLFDPAKVRGWANEPERLEWNFGATVQTANIPQLSHVTLGIYGDIALGNVDINGVRQVIFDASV